MIKMFQVKILFHIHGKGIINRSSFEKKLYRYAFYNEKIILLSKLLKYDVNDLYNGEFYYIPNGIPDVDFSKLSRHDSQHHNTCILFLSNLILSKGIIDYINALDILYRKDIKFEGLIVGAEADFSKKQLNNFLIEKKLKGIIKYIGSKYGLEKEIILNNADILVFPTYYENETFGIVNIEAMQFSHPVISTRVGAIPEIIDHSENGFIVEINNPEKIAFYLAKLIQNPELLRQMGSKAREKYLNHYTIKLFEQNLMHVFKDVLK